MLLAFFDESILAITKILPKVTLNAFNMNSSLRTNLGLSTKIYLKVEFIITS